MCPDDSDISSVSSSARDVEGDVPAGAAGRLREDVLRLYDRVEVGIRAEALREESDRPPTLLLLPLL